MISHASTMFHGNAAHVDSRTRAGRSPSGSSRALRSTSLLCLPLALLLQGDVAASRTATLIAVDPFVVSMILLLAAGVLSGLLSGLLGIGGALITIPALHLALPGLGIHASLLSSTAVATALMAMLPITLVASWRQQRHGAIETGWLRRMAGPMACGAAGGALLAAALNGPVLAVLFALQSCWYGARLLLDRRGADGRSYGRGILQRCVQLPTWLAVPPMAAFCACVGMGGGSMITPFFLRRGVLFRHAVATAGALNLCIALGGSLAFALSSVGSSRAAGCVPAAVLLAVGAMSSVTFGVSLAHRVPAVVLQRLVGLVNLTSAGILLLQVALH